VVSSVLLEVPHFASVQEDASREVIVLRSDNGVTWTQQPTVTLTDDSVSSLLAQHFDSKRLLPVM